MPYPDGGPKKEARLSLGCDRGGVVLGATHSNKEIMGVQRISGPVWFNPRNSGRSRSTCKEMEGIGYARQPRGPRTVATTGAARFRFLNLEARLAGQHSRKRRNRWEPIMFSLWSAIVGKQGDSARDGSLVNF